jgi:hypothetical protein
MSVPAGPARFAGITGRIDIADHAATEPRRIGRLNHLAHKLVSERTAEGQVAPHKLDIGITNAGQPHPDQGFAGQGPGIRIDWPVMDAVVADQSTHVSHYKVPLLWDEIRHPPQAASARCGAFGIPKRLFSSHATRIGTALKIEE